MLARSRYPFEPDKACNPYVASGVRDQQPSVRDRGPSVPERGLATRWVAVGLCYGACLASFTIIWILFMWMQNGRGMQSGQGAAIWGVALIATFDLIAIVATFSILLRGSHLERLVAYPGIYLSLFFATMHVIAWWT